MPAFARLWSNHPNVKGDAPLLDKTVYENQCAINMSADWISWLQIHARIGSVGINSDFRAAESKWFWAVP